MSKKLDIVVAIFIAGLLAFTFGVQTGYSWTGNWNTISDGYIEIEQVNATQYYWNDANRTILLSGQNAIGATSYVGFDSNLDYLPNYWYCDGTADDVQIQVAIDYVDGLGGGSVYLEAGIYDITLALNISNVLGVSIIGYNYATTILKQGAAVNIFEANTTIAQRGFMEFKNLNIMGKKETYSSGNGIYIDRTGAGSFIDVRFESVYIANFANYSFWADGGWGYRFDECIFERSDDGGFYMLAGAGFASFSQCRFGQNGGHGAQISENYVRIQNCEFHVNDGAGLLIQGHDSVIVGNSFVQNDGHGIWIGGPRATVTGNVFYSNNDVEATDSSIFVGSNGDESIIMGNLVNGFAKARYGVFVSGAEDVIVSSNELKDHVTKEIINTGVNTIIKDNIGWYTSKSGTQTCANNEDIAHGLAGTPTFVDVTPMNDTYDGKALFATVDWSNVDATNIQVGLYWFNGTAISDDLILVAWEAEYEP